MLKCIAKSFSNVDLALQHLDIQIIYLSYSAYLVIYYANQACPKPCYALILIIVITVHYMLYYLCCFMSPVIIYFLPESFFKDSNLAIHYLHKSSDKSIQLCSYPQSWNRYFSNKKHYYVSHINFSLLTPNFCFTYCSIATKRLHNQGNSYKRKNFIKIYLLFQRFSP